MRDDDPKWLEIVAKDQAWERAENYYIENRAHEFPENTTLEICIESNRKHKMTPHCWAVLIAQYST